MHQIIVVGDSMYGCIINPDDDCGNDDDTKNNKWDYRHLTLLGKLKINSGLMSRLTPIRLCFFACRTNQREKRNVPTWQLKRAA
ncbi:hypothetical protein [Sideroxyarcus emersonii]|uniref:hypothetical protein n=1 Tax=Sideroxyarcus emersonii TaxID=2764705 RepID=UPI001F20DEE6|nr:hypothetical protein [Sideroxyarcus emersonii]